MRDARLVCEPVAKPSTITLRPGRDLGIVSA